MQLSLYRSFFMALIVASLSVPTLSAAEIDRSKPADPKNVPQTVKTSDGRELKLVWHDEFDGEGLPDPEKWSFEVGYIRNNEAQYYTDSRLENVFQKDGVLTIRSLKERYSLADKPANHGREYSEYTSGSIETLGKASWLYGRVEIRARLPKGKGIWPAIWMMGTNITTAGYPDCGEIDIMEYVGKEKERVYGTIHMKRPGGGGVVSRGNNILLDRPEDQFFTYNLEWTPEKLLILFDDEPVLEFNRADEEKKTEVWPFDKPQFLKLNTALGGAWSGEIAPDTCPTDFQIDYVRVYQ